MAAAPVMNAYLRNVLEIDASLANSPLRRAIVTQGINNFDTLRNKHEDRLGTIFSTIRRPGGQVPNPAHPGQFIRNNGQNLSAQDELRIRQLVFAARYFWFVQRNFAPAQATLQNLESLWEFKEAQDEHDNTAIAPPGRLTSVRNMRQTIE